MSSYSLTICLTLLRGTGFSFTLSHFPVLAGGIGLYPSRNCSSGGNMMPSCSLTICLTLLRGIGLYVSLNCSGGRIMS